MKHPCYRCKWAEHRGIGASRNVIFCPRIGMDGVKAVNLGHCRRIRQMPARKADMHFLRRKMFERWPWYRQGCDGYLGARRRNGRATERPGVSPTKPGRPKDGGQLGRSHSGQGDKRAVHAPNRPAPKGDARKMGRQDTAKQSRALDGLRA